MFSFPTTSPKYREINLQETKKKTVEQLPVLVDAGGMPVEQASH